MNIQRVDSHQHFLKPDAVKYCWMTPDMPLAKDFLPQDLKPLLDKHAIDKTVLVEAADSEEENEFMFELARQHSFIAGVVIWLDMESPEFEARLSHHLQNPEFIGIRPMIESIADDAWMLRKSVRNSFGVLQESRVCFDFLTHPRHLPHTLKVLAEFPDLRAVVDHISKPPIRNQEFQPWADLMKQIASHENVYCKLSGMVTEADHRSWKPADLAAYIRHIVEVFGPERCMFGSDWPVCLLAGSYDRVVDALKQNLKDLTDEQLQEIFGGTASRFYRI
jgi:L-fucono-1,5-lactonase